MQHCDQLQGTTCRECVTPELLFRECHCQSLAFAFPACLLYWRRCGVEDADTSFIAVLVRNKRMQVSFCVMKWRVSFVLSPISGRVFRFGNGLHLVNVKVVSMACSR